MGNCKTLNVSVYFGNYVEPYYLWVTVKLRMNVYTLVTMQNLTIYE